MSARHPGQYGLPCSTDEVWTRPTLEDVSVYRTGRPATLSHRVLLRPPFGPLRDTLHCLPADEPVTVSLVVTGDGDGPTDHDRTGTFYGRSGPGARSDCR